MPNHNLEVVIPAAGMGYRMKSYGPKALIQLPGGEPLIMRQVRLIRELYPNAPITVVAGFEAKKLRQQLPASVRVIVNRDPEHTNVGHSIGLGLNRTKADRVLVVYGDIVFNRETISNFPAESCIVIDQSEGRDYEVGVNVVDGMVSCFSYALPLKWAHIAMLTGKEKRLFSEICVESHRHRHFGYEILNEIVERGGSLQAISPPGSLIVEIDTAKDLETALESTRILG